MLCDIELQLIKLGSIDLEYIDPRPENRKEADKVLKEEEKRKKERKDKEWEIRVEAAKAIGLEEPQKPEELMIGSVRPDWEQSPLEVSCPSSFKLYS